MSLTNTNIYSLLYYSEQVKELLLNVKQLEQVSRRLKFQNLSSRKFVCSEVRGRDISSHTGTGEFQQQHHCQCSIMMEMRVHHGVRCTQVERTGCNFKNYIDITGPRFASSSLTLQRALPQS